MKYILDKLVIFFVNLSVAGFAVALFQNKPVIMAPAFASLVIAISLMIIVETIK